MKTVETILGFLALVVVVAIVALAMWGCPKYNIYLQKTSGEAELRKAQQNRQIITESAQAKKDAAEYQKQADVIRAEGVAKALRIVRNELTDMTDEQARVLILYKWVEGLHDGSSEVIYVPTEASLPLFLEAGRITRRHGKAEHVGQVAAELQRDVATEEHESGERVDE